MNAFNFALPTRLHKTLLVQFQQTYSTHQKFLNTHHLFFSTFKFAIQNDVFSFLLIAHAIFRHYKGIKQAKKYSKIKNI